MCETFQPDPEDVTRSKLVVGRDCPACEGAGGRLAYMEFLDPHDRIRLDPTLFECESKTHSFVLTKAGDLRLLAENGVRSKERRSYVIAELSGSSIA